MNTYYQRRRALLRLAIIAFIGALFFGWLFYRSVSASTVLLIRLYHDQDHSATVTPGDIPAAGVAVVVTEQCTEIVCAASRTAYIAFSDSNGYVSLDLQENTSYDVTAPCMAMSVQASDVSGQSVTEWATCAQGLWLPVVGR